MSTAARGVEAHDDDRATPGDSAEGRVESNGVDLKIIGLMLFSVSFGVLGQVFFRSGMKGINQEPGLQVLWHFTRPVIIAGCICYGVATSSWLVIISKVPLSLAYPMVSISYLAVVLLGRFYFHEPVSIYTWCGVFLVCSGVVLMGFGNQATREALKSSPTPPASSATPAGGG